MARIPQPRAATREAGAVPKLDAGGRRAQADDDEEEAVAASSGAVQANDGGRGDCAGDGAVHGGCPGRRGGAQRHSGARGGSPAGGRYLGQRGRYHGQSPRGSAGGAGAGQPRGEPHRHPPARRAARAAPLPQVGHRQGCAGLLHRVAAGGGDGPAVLSQACVPRLPGAGGHGADVAGGGRDGRDGGHELERVMRPSSRRSTAPAAARQGGGGRTPQSSAARGARQRMLFGHGCARGLWCALALRCSRGVTM
mmetsp:Transcript_12040/g.30903  ORF Transcript_12040/g.30903 Transcript_12040/m.30903 type:complete len:252 (+) Transcript_12040:911-1666(+)